MVVGGLYFNSVVNDSNEEEYFNKHISLKKLFREDSLIDINGILSIKNPCEE
jgi:hypothetical protein